MALKKTTMEFFNRELSWLEFNQRVLEESRSADNPPLERLKFLAIAASNLDEFFMVRVGSLHMARKDGRRKKDPSGLTPLAQLREIGTRAQKMMTDLHRCFNEVVSPALSAGKIKRLTMDALTTEQESALFDHFREELYPVITPIAVEPGRSFPQLPNLALNVLVYLRKRGAKKQDCYAVISLDRCGDRIIQLPAAEGYDYVLLEEALIKYVAHWFPGYEVQECAPFRITRNADFAVREEEAPDLLAGMEDVLEERKLGDCIRLEVPSGISPALLSFLCAHIPVRPESVYAIEGSLNLKDFMPLSFLEGYDELKTEAWPPQASPNIVPNEPMFDQIAQRDLLLYHPYETFDPVVRFIEESAVDPDTLAIKMVLYRTSSRSAIIAALKTAAENGVNVTVLMELKARFDEARNMSWARDLEQCGVQVIYGVKGYKTHAKICLVVRREPSGIVRYCHFGTGNYNESTARLYGDISYMTCNSALGADASAFFNALCGYAQPQQFNLISMAPINMRDRLVELIDAETERARKGKKARISAKINSLVDPVLIQKLYEASAAGVQIQLNVRGICCLKPDGRIEVRSIVDRFLEHARIIYFHHAGKPLVFIASADWMPRNLDKRLELMVPVEDAACRERLIQILETHLSDTQSSWMLRRNGSYRRCRAEGVPLRSQAALYAQACEAIENARKSRRTRFVPHRAADNEAGL
ncbi:MAG: polyphosphate kinase 1 [Pontiellaceae bacterium]|nr:polyphosphate kinase 1 [Pontiellaceae bacterium]